MAPPIDVETVRSECWTQRDGTVRYQAVAEGDEKDPGTFVQRGSVLVRNAGRITTYPGIKILGPFVKLPGGEVQEDRARGIWVRVPPPSTR